MNSLTIDCERVADVAFIIRAVESLSPDIFNNPNQPMLVNAFKNETGLEERVCERRTGQCCVQQKYSSCYYTCQDLTADSTSMLNHLLHFLGASLNSPPPQQLPVIFKLGL